MRIDKRNNSDKLRSKGMFKNKKMFFQLSEKTKENLKKKKKIYKILFYKILFSKGFFLRTKQLSCFVRQKKIKNLQSEVSFLLF